MDVTVGITGACSWQNSVRETSWGKEEIKDEAGNNGMVGADDVADADANDADDDDDVADADSLVDAEDV